MIELIRKSFTDTNEEELTATIIWSALVEPGDRISGILRATYGSAKALKLVLARQVRPPEGLSTSELTLAYERWLPRYSPELAVELIRKAARGDMQVLLPTDELWPKSLAQLGPHAPLALWFRGHAQNFLALKRAVAIVGSRTCTSYGQRVTADTVTATVNNQAAIVSGGALGVDSVAHRVALAQTAQTTAVMAGSLDNLYPSGNWQLFDEIGHKGLLISEMVPGAKPTRWRFLQRNRLIAALSEAVVVTEAGWRSGSINTANHAATLNRRVFAIPGPIHSPTSAGCNRLIRDLQAELLLDPSELPGELGWKSNDMLESNGLGHLELRALDALSRSRKSIESVAIKAGLTIGEAQIALTSLQLDSLAEGSYEGWRLL